MATIFISACVAGIEAVQRLIHPSAPGHLAVPAAAGAIGYLGNWLRAQIRTRGGRRLQSSALIADGAPRPRRRVRLSRRDRVSDPRRTGATIADPITGLAITLVILRITWQSWQTVREHEHHRPASSFVATLLRRQPAASA